MALTDTDRAPLTVEVEHLADYSVEFFEPARIHTTPMGTRLEYMAKHAVVEGPRLRGEILPGGGDWVLAGADGVARLDARFTIKTHDDALIYGTFTGRGRLDDEAMARFTAGELIRWDELYARSAHLYETGAEAYAWLNSAVTIAVTQLSLTHVDHRVFLVR